MPALGSCCWQTQGCWDVFTCFSGLKVSCSHFPTHSLLVGARSSFETVRSHGLPIPLDLHRRDPGRDGLGWFPNPSQEPAARVTRRGGRVRVTPAAGSNASGEGHTVATWTQGLWDSANGQGRLACLVFREAEKVIGPDACG